MDKIYSIPKSEPVSFKKILDEFVTELKKTEFPENDQDVQRLMGMERKNTVYEKVKSSTSLELLDSPDDVRVAPYVPGISEFKRKTTKQNLTIDARLNSVQKLIKEKEASYGSPFIKTQDSFKQVHTPVNPADHNLEPFSDVVISVRFYRPKTDTPLKRRTYPTFSEEFKCLGSNFLSELRDKISCVCNKKRFFELSENPKVENPEKLCDPGFFFIENTFYNDMRNPANADYSEVIREWSRKKTKCYQKIPFQTRRMEKTRFIDLEVSLGFPQLYQHHGNCEHLFTFSYVELLSIHTCLVRELYPLLKSVNAYNAKFCHMCGKREYVYVVKNSKRQLHDPAYLCSVCFISFHYVNGKKVDEFNAYRLVSYNEKLDDHECFIVEHLEVFDDIDESVEEEEEGPGPSKIKKEI
ncbi:snRNA-activating protein complex subunit 3 [Episyrphus balteatus]|uniref:snRNA-activating protein complex subunit 3 n=1 Tax=Episyrphus balteatus TaxID=286459 RepID=UPI0024860980|nr:snRNA-activating protein complex subunit 3 [Episyrphus balteatus]